MSLSRALIESLHRHKNYDLSSQGFTVDKIVMLGQAIEIDANIKLTELETKIITKSHLQLSLAQLQLLVLIIESVVNRRKQVYKMETWQDYRRSTLEIEADTIDAAVLSLERLDGMFEARSIADTISTCINVLRVQESNRRKAIGDNEATFNGNSTTSRTKRLDAKDKS